jgi:hypothetical protein
MAKKLTLQQKSERGRSERRQIAQTASKEKIEKKMPQLLKPTQCLIR